MYPGPKSFSESVKRVEPSWQLSAGCFHSSHGESKTAQLMARTAGLRGRRFSQNVPQKSNTDCGYPTFDLFSERFPLQELPGQCTWRDGPSVQLLGTDVVARNTDLIVY